jgi:glutathione S-transferase
VERELQRHGIDHETVRVPPRQRDRDEVFELTGQRKVPVLEIGREVVFDSTRIVEHLRWRSESAA